MDTFTLNITSPLGTKIYEDVESVYCKLPLGKEVVLAKHEPFISYLKPAAVEVGFKEGKKVTIQLCNSSVVFLNNTYFIVTNQYKLI